MVSPSLAVAGLAAALVALALPAAAGAPPPRPYRVLVYTNTAGFRHESIEPAVKAIRRLGKRHNFTVTATAEPAKFTDASLAKYRALVFVSTTGDVLPVPEQREALERYIRRGGGWLGIHAASDMGDVQTTWPWYHGLVGAAFRAHPATQRATIRVEKPRAHNTRFLPRRWSRVDEWYAFQENPRGKVRVLLTLDESSYQPGEAGMGADHPIAWCRRYRGGRLVYTAIGHTAETFAERSALKHLRRSIQMAAGKAPFRCPVARGGG